MLRSLISWYDGKLIARVAMECAFGVAFFDTNGGVELNGQKNGLASTPTDWNKCSTSTLLMLVHKPNTTVGIQAPFIPSSGSGFILRPE